MGAYPSPPDAAQWRIAVRFLTFGIMVAGLIAVMWWMSRLANHLEDQRKVLLLIQRDVLLVQSTLDTSKVTLDENARRLVNVEERVANGSDDRRQMRATDAQLTEALIRLRALVEQHLEYDGGEGPGNPATKRLSRPRLDRGQ